MIKANAYGHGLIRIAKALKHVDALGVASVDEAKVIRQAGVKTTIVLMAGFFSASELKFIAALNCEIVVHRPEQIDILAKAKLSTPIKVWLKINTGMNRLGVFPDKVKDCYQRLMNCSAVNKPVNLMTHLANADVPTDSTTKKQIAAFNAATSGLEGERSLANSSGILMFPETHGDWVRPGIMLFGATALVDHEGKDFNLKPVMTLQSELITIHQQGKGDSIGYGCTWTCPEDMLVGIVAIGYGDGYPRHAKAGAPVLINDRVCPLIGRVAMDMIAVDLRSYKKAQVGDSVILWGKGLPVERVAAYADTIAYEPLCGIARRVHGAE
jgi:alanine racemase